MTIETRYVASIYSVILILMAAVAMLYADSTKADSITAIVGGSSYHLDTRDYTQNGITYDINEVHPAIGVRFGFGPDYDAIEHGAAVIFINENSFREKSFCSLYSPRYNVESIGFVGARLGLCTGYEHLFSHGIAPVAGLEAGIELMENAFLVFGAQVPEVVTFHMEYKF